MTFQVTKKVSDVVADVKRTFGDEASVQVADSDIIRWVNQAQTEIVSKNQILTAVATVVGGSVANQYAYNVSGLNIQAIKSIHFRGVKIDNLTFQESEEFISKDDPQHVAVGFPDFWYQWANEISFYPTPAQSGDEIKIYYYALPTVVTGTTDALSLPDNYYNRILEFVMAAAYEMDENFDAASMKTNRFDSNLVGMQEDEDKTSQLTYSTITVRPEDM